jgi:D-glycero-beta-D-manno-heptose-7-phosphate kinase
MVRLTGTFSRLGKAKVLVIGDILLDTYTIGKARRISPEAPVAVVHVHQEDHRPGGAGNVMLNLVSMGAEVVAVGRVGQDPYGELLLKAFEKENVSTQGILVQHGYPTPVKNRIIAENQQIVRVDYEKIIPIPEMLEQQVIEMLPSLMKDVKVVAISDYGKGFLSRTLLAAIIDQARLEGIPVIADPKGIDFQKYSGSTIIKPNLSEAYAAANLPSDAPLEQVAAKVLELAQADVLMVTRSEAGISLFYKNGERDDYPVRIREVKDVTGAGDTVLAMLACAIANGLPITEAAQLSNIAAGIAIERFGCARVSLSELARRLLDFDTVNKVFDVEQLFALQEALRGRKFVILGLSGARGLTSKIFSSIRQFGNRQDCDLLVYVQEDSPSEEFVDILAALHDVDFIILKGESLRSLCDRIAPEEVYVINGDHLHKLDDTESLVNCVSS